MKGQAIALSGNAGLAVHIAAADWGFFLRRADLRPDAVFLGYHGSEVGPAQVARFVPNWAALRWSNVPDGLLSRSESSALDGPFLLTVRAHVASPRDHAAVIAAFLEFMAQTEA